VVKMARQIWAAAAAAAWVEAAQLQMLAAQVVPEL
jgi:hypothetical protein